MWSHWVHNILNAHLKLEYISAYSKLQASETVYIYAVSMFLRRLAYQTSGLTWPSRRWYTTCWVSDLRGPAEPEPPIRVLPQTLQNVVWLPRVHHCRTQTEHIARGIVFMYAYHMSCINHDVYTQYAYYDINTFVIIARCSKEHAITHSLCCICGDLWQLHFAVHLVQTMRVRSRLDVVAEFTVNCG